MANKIKRESIRFNLPIGDKTKLMIRCVKNKTNMTNVLNSLVKAYLKNENIINSDSEEISCQTSQAQSTLIKNDSI